jgi:hypothetical protein
MDEMPLTRLELSVKADRLAEFFPLLQQGVGVTVRVGCTLEELLTGQWGIGAEYLAGRITTIFLNSRAIDDVATAMIGDGGVLALSGAMPGLVGATMRRGGFYAAMRGAMTYQEAVAAGPGIGTIRVKLFNLLLPELGPGFLRRGILLDAATAASFFREKADWFWTGCEEIMLDGAPAGPDALLTTVLPDNGAVSLTVAIRGEQ